MAFFLFVLVFSCGSATAATINVHPGTNAIKNAITKAHSGDTLKLSAGTYKEHKLVIKKNLIITGPVKTGTPTAVIDAQKLDRVFIINSGAQVTMKYLTIKNGYTLMDYGGGIFNVNGKVTVIGCNINHNYADLRGGGISNYAGTVKVYNSNINNNCGNFYGGGIYSNGVLTVSNSNITSNVAGRGAGICNDASGTCKVTKTNFYANSAQLGAGIFNGKTLTVTSCEFKLNKASLGNAVCNFVKNGSNIMRYNRLLDTTSNSEVDSQYGAVDARYNWWGSNKSPSSKISTYKGTVNFTPWIKI